MLARVWLIAVCSVVPLFAQAPCEGTPAYSPCEFVFELTAAEAAPHPNPYVSVELRIEFRSPRFRTFMMPAYWGGGRKMIVRFAPTEAGGWVYRVSSNIASLEGKQGTFNATESDAPGYVHAANVHHWVTENKKAHLWMGYVIDHFGTMPAADFDRQISAAEANKFTHLRGSVLGTVAEQARAYPAPDQPNLAYFDELDKRVQAVHKKRITTDLLLGADPDAIVKMFPDWQTRKRFVRYLVARYGALNVSWQLVEEFEGHANARGLLKELGLALKELDTYQHPRSTSAKVSSSPLLNDGWMDYIIDHSSDDQLGSVEHQFYHVPFVGLTGVKHLWNSTMDGQYPEIEGPVGQEPKGWFDVMADTRHWELEPYFDVDAGRAVALEGIEYVVLVEKSGPVEVEVEKHGYDVEWFNPLNGESISLKKYKGEHFTGSAPDASHPWVLLIAREGRKESMLKSYRFTSRDVFPLQEIEQDVTKVPFAIAEPGGDTMGTGPVRFAAKLKRETRATRAMMYVWTAEVPADGQGFRILGTGTQGTFRIPSDIASRSAGAISIRLSALNANGKAYATDKVYQLVQ